MPRRLASLLIELETPPPRSELFLVYPNKQSPIARPVDINQLWLDVRAGDEVFLKGKRRRVSVVCVYRGDGAGSDEPVVECGREWIEG